MQINNHSQLQPVDPSAKIAIVRARFNTEITQNLINGAILSYLKSEESIHDLSDELVAISQGEHPNIDLFEVAGAVEIPLIAQKAAKSGKYSATLVLGAVIKGQTPHFDYVCKLVSEGVMRVSLDQQIPVIFGIITVNTPEQAEARSVFGPEVNLNANAGYSGMQTALEMIQLSKKFE